MENPSYYAIIIAPVRYDNRLKPNEKLLFAEITALSDMYGCCFATNSYFANLYEVSKETVSRWVSHLSELGYIKVDFTYKKGSKEIDKRYIVIDSAMVRSKSLIDGVPTPLMKNATPLDEKRKDNSTENNIIEYNNTIEVTNHVVLPEGKTTPLQIDFEKLPSMLENLHTCQDEQDGCVSESENCVLEKSEEGAGAKIQFSEKFKINPTAENKFLGLSKTKQAKVIEVMEAFVDITGKRDGLTKERLGNILARLGEQVLSGDDEAVNVELKHFKAVFEYKNEAWQNDDKMRGYIQIETLCSGKFHKYLEEAREAYKNKQKPQGVANNQQPAKRKLGGIG